MGSDGALVHAQRRLTRQQFAHAFNYLFGEPLPGRPEQRIDQTSAVRNFVIGSRRVVGMTVYHYAKMQAGKAIDTDGKIFRGAGNTWGLDEPNTAAAPATVAVGSMSFQIVDAVSAAHKYQNGRVTVWGVGIEYQVFDILDSDVTDLTNVLLYLRTPVRVAIPAGTMCSLVPNIYSAVAYIGDIGTNLAPIVGIPQMYVAAGCYFWLPTYGLVQIAQGEELNGIGGPDVYFSFTDGCGWKLASLVAAAASWQRAGHMALEQTDGRDCNLWLQLDP